MTQDDIKKLTLRAAKESKLRDILWMDERIETYYDEVVAVIDFATHLIAAYIAEQEPVAWIDDEGTLTFRHNWMAKKGTKLFTAPPLPDTAPQEGTTRPAAPPARETPVGAATLPEEVQRMSEWLRGDCWHDAARLLERLAAENAALTRERDMWRATDLRDAARVDELAAQLAASQAREAKLREALQYCAIEPGYLSAHHNAQHCHAQNALNSIPADTSALDARLAEEREKCAAYALAHGCTSMVTAIRNGSMK